MSRLDRDAFIYRDGKIDPYLPHAMVLTSEIEQEMTAKLEGRRA